MPISPFGAARVAAALAALPGAAIVVIGAALRLPATAVTIAGALLCFVFGSWLFVAAGVFRSPAPHETRPPMTLRDRPMRAESRSFQKRSLPRKASIALLNFSGL